MPATSTSTTPPPATLARTTAAPTLGALVLRASGRYPDAAALRLRDPEGWRDITFTQLGEISREIARGLIALGIAPGDPVAILASTRAEWTLVDCGAHCAGAVVVPVYHTNSPAECHYVLEHSEARLLFCEDAEQLAKVQEVRDRLPKLEHVVTFDGAEGTLSLDDLRARGAQVDPDAVDQAVAGVSPDDVATIVYTSGTTGPPKGCLTTHRNLVATIAMYNEVLEFRPGQPVVIFMFLPLAHSLARITQLVSIDIGATLAFWRGDAKLVLEDVTDIKPTHLPSVPRVFEKIHTKALAGVEDAGGVKALLFRWAVSVGREARRHEREGRSPSPLLRVQRVVADRLVLSKVRGLFGGRLELALTGAAPIAVDVLEFFDACGVPVLEGYGLTESTAAATLNTMRDRRLGTVGPALPGTEVTIAPDGEILLAGPHVFPGYHKNADATREALSEDGRLRTGDLGEVDGDGFLRVTGRKKDLIITSSGKNITPSNIESALRESRWVSQAVVYGDKRPYVVAALTLDPEEAPALAERLGVAADPASMAADPRVREAIQADVDAANKQFARIEQVKRFAILDHDLTQDGGELTPTMKIKRNVVYDRYAEVFTSLYDDND